MLHATSFKVFLRKDKLKGDGSAPIYIRVTKHRKPTLFSIGESCTEREWDEKTQRLWTTKPRLSEKDRVSYTPDQYKTLELRYKEAKVHPQAARINARIDDTLETIQNAEKDLRNKKEKVSVKSIREKVIDTKQDDQSYLNFFYTQLNDVIKIEQSYNTYRAYSSTYKKLIEYQKGRDLLFEDITYEFLEGFYLDMIKEEYRPESIKKHFKWMKAIWRKAKKKKIVTTYPFEDFEIKGGEKTYKERLSTEEIKKLIRVKLTGKDNDVRNMFLFAFFHAGIRISDILRLKWSDISDNRVRYTMKKTNKKTDYSLHKIGAGILNQYKKEGQSKSDYIFGFLENGLDEASEYFERQIQAKTSIVNKHLKDVAKEAQINKTITTHLARHSYGAIAAEADINAFDLSYSMMHSKIQTTDTYIGGVNRERQDKVFEKVYRSFKTKSKVNGEG